MVSPKPSNRGRVSPIIVSLLVGLATVSSFGVVSADITYVSISNVSISEDELVTGDSVTITPTILHSSTGDGGFQVNEVMLVSSDGEQLTEVSNLGTIGAGESFKVPLRTSFEEAGEKRLTLRVRGVALNSSGKIESVESIEYPVYVDVSAPSEPDPEAKPRVSVSANTMVSGASAPVHVTVANSYDSDISDLTIHLSDSKGQIQKKTKIQPVLPARNISTFVFNISPASSGELTLNATAEYDGGSTQAVQTVDVVPFQNKVFVDATIRGKNGTDVIQYQVTNAGNAPINNVLISGQGSNTDLTRASIDTVSGSSTETTTVPVGSVPSSLSLNLSYTAGGQQYHVSESLHGDALDASSNREQNALGIGSRLNNIPITSIGLLFGGLAVGGAIGHRQRLRNILRNR